MALVAVVCSVVGNTYCVVLIVITLADSVTDVAPAPAIFLNLKYSPSLAENTPIPDAPTFDAPLTATLAFAARLSCATKMPCAASYTRI